MHRYLYRTLLLGALGACNDATSEPPVPYALGQALVVGDDDRERRIDLDETCDDAECEAVRERCGGRAYADVVLDENGSIADVLCYRGNVHVVEIDEDGAPSAEAGNNTVLVLDGIDDGADVSGDVTISGNNAIVYGEGADVSVIGGSLIIEKNNAIARGVSIGGDVSIDKNNAQLAFVTIDGDLTINGNNVTLVESVVYGTVTISGNNAVLVGNQLQGVDSLSAKNLVCNDNQRFDDADDDHVIDELEIGATISCDAQTGSDGQP